LRRKEALQMLAELAGASAHHRPTAFRHETRAHRLAHTRVIPAFARRAFREFGPDRQRPGVSSSHGREEAPLLADSERCQLRQALPARSAAQIAAMLKLRHGIAIPDRTIRQQP
jgi:hypothetical protein